MLFFFEKFNWASGPVFALASFRLRQDYADKLLKEMILQSSKLRFTLLDNNQLWYLFFYQGCDYIYVSLFWIFYFMILQVFKGVDFCRYSQSLLSH